MAAYEPPARSFSVLIADGQELFRNGLRALLDTMGGFTIAAEVSTERDMLEQLTKSPADLVLLDASLSDGHFQDLLSNLKQLDLAPAFIVFSTTVDIDQLIQAILLGAGGYLTKNLPKQTVANALERWQQGAFALTLSTETLLIQTLVDRYHALEQSLYASSQSHVRGSEPFALALAEAALPGDAHGLTHLTTHKLTQQELRVYHLLYQGMSNKQIAVRLAISPYTVGKHVQQILRKLGVSNRTQAVSYTSHKVDMNGKL